MDELLSFFLLLLLLELVRVGVWVSVIINVPLRFDSMGCHSLVELDKDVSVKSTIMELTLPQRSLLPVTHLLNLTDLGASDSIDDLAES